MVGARPVYTPQFSGGTVPNATTFLSTLTINKTAASGVEDILIASISDDLVAKLKFSNGSATDARFLPRIIGQGSNAQRALDIVAEVNADTGAEAGQAFIARVITSNAALTTRAPFKWFNGSNLVLDTVPLNSGAGLALAHGSGSGTAIPAVTTRSSGTRYVIHPTISGSAFDIAIGLQSNGVWNSLNSTGNSWFWYAGSSTTPVATLSGLGKLITTGARVDKLRTALTSPVTVDISSDYVIETDLTTPGAVAVNLPASPNTGLTYIIKDGKGDANVNNVTITPAAGNIDGAGTYVINTAYGRVKLMYNGTKWLVLST